MMKQLYIKIIFLGLFIFSFGYITAQTCSVDFTVKTVSTPSTCQANGTITVTLEGDLTNIHNVQYGLTSTDGFVINPQDNNVLTNLPAGKYMITVRAFCQINSDYDVVKTISNVTVGGNYKVPSVSFNASSSRKSYDICNTGVIALNVTDGSGNFTFNIVSAPEGATTGIITPTKSGTLYIFPGANYPAGEYVVRIEDGCYTSVATFTLEQISGFPGLYHSNYQGGRPTLIDNLCNSLNWYTGTVNTGNPDYYRYYMDGMYEIGAAPSGSEPTVWTAWINSNVSSGRLLLLDIAPYNYTDFYTTGSLTVFTRLKGCDNGYRTNVVYLKKPAIYSSVANRKCENYTHTIKAWTDYDGVMCYPIALEVTKTIGGEVVYSNPSWSYNASGQDVVLDYNTSYIVKATDANGTTATYSTSQSRNLTFTNDIVNCDNYQLQYYAPSGTSCWPIMVSITDSQGKVVCTDSITNTNVYKSCALAFGESYKVKVTYPNTNPVYTYEVTKSLTSTLPTSISVVLGYSNQCREDNGYFRIYPNNGMWTIGTTVTITGPAGYTPQTVTVTNTSSNLYTSITDLPAGEYTATVDYGCGTPLVFPFTFNGVYSGRNLSYTTENTCSGMKVTPSGSMTYQGNPITTYYRLVDGPTGYDKTVIAAGKSFVFSTPGRYILGILNTNSATGCAIKQDTINYTGSPLSLDQTGSSAYECVDTFTGIILLKAQNGVAPYTYQLWDKTNTTKLVATDLVSADQVHFKYGQADSTYTARIIDKCGNMFSQQITMARLSTARIVYATDNNVCTGDTIELKCITLGKTAYHWTGPNNYVNNSQNPKIGDANVDMTGWYRVTVMPEFCGEPVEDSVYVRVYPPLMTGAVTDSQVVCVRTVADSLTCVVTGGSLAYTYQWQSSPDGLSNWTNIAGATSSTYTPPIKIQSQTNYYRLVVSDKCGVVNSNVIPVNFEPCYIPVNPDLRLRPGNKKGEV